MMRVNCRSMWGRIFAAALCLTGSAKASDVGDEGFIADFGAHFDAVLEEYGVPGGALVVVSAGEVALKHVYGKRRTGVGAPVTAETVFPLASVSKTFAGTLAAMMVADGSFKLDEPLRLYAPEFRTKNKTHSNAIRLEHVLAHSTGLVPNAYDNILEAGRSVDVILPRFAELDAMCAPGECYGYQNIVFSLMERAVENRSGRSYGDQLTARIIKPLALEHTMLGEDGLKASGNYASPHVKRRGQWQPRRLSTAYYKLAPASGLNSNINDLGVWLLAQLGKRPDVLPPTVRKLIAQPRTKTRRELYRRHWRQFLDSAYYGLGWRLYDFEGINLLYHGGAISGFRASVAVAPQLGIGLALLMNGESRAMDKLATDFWALVAARQAAPSPSAENASADHTR